MRNKAFWVLLAIGLLSPLMWGESATAPAAKGPRMIMIIRHAEKPADSATTKNPDLSPAGVERAAALAKVIPEHFPKPDFLFATKRSAHSNRPVETIEPLSKAMHLPIDDNFADADVTGIAHEVLTNAKYDGATILIAWHHEKIPDLAKALGVTNAPDSWKAEVFDRVWEITYDNGKATFVDMPQKAMAGDAEK
jgi:broad specificity phosphatase PhoE